MPAARISNYLTDPSQWLGRNPLRRRNRRWRTLTPDNSGTASFSLDLEISAVVSTRNRLNEGTCNSEWYSTIPFTDGSRPHEGADIEGSGAIDVVVGNSANDQLSVFMGASDGTFELIQTYGIDTTVRGTTILGLDNDRAPEVATTTGT